MDEKERLLRFKLSLVDGVGSKTFQKIIEAFGSVLSFEKALSLDKPGKMNKNMFDRIRMGWYLFDMNKFLEDFAKYKLNYVVLGEEVYPKYLSQVFDPPMVLFSKSVFQSNLFDNCISIVGTRKSSQYGSQITKNLANYFVQNGFSIVSGLAFGIDSYAHKAALEAKGGTVAVLAGSAHEASPTGNWKLFDQINKDPKSIVISETLPGKRIAQGMFPKRNRIVAGLSKATIVVEAGSKSGALITARVAFEENRHVYAVPGDLDKSRSRGSNKLIWEQKADILVHPENVLTDLGFASNEKVLLNDKDKIVMDISNSNRMIYESIRKEPQEEDSLSRQFDISISNLLASLMDLEIKGLVVKREDGKYHALI